MIFEQYHRIGKDGKRYWGKMGAGIIFTDGKKVLLLKRDKKSDYPHHWCLPGGKAKKGESPIDTAKRESEEECGHSEGTRLDDFHSQDGSHHFYSFLFSVPKEFNVKLSHEHEESHWFPIDQVENLNLHPKFKESWPTYLRAITKKLPQKTSFSEWLSLKESL